MTIRYVAGYLCALALALVVVGTFGEADGQVVEQTATRPSLEVLKRLAGDWVRLDENGEPTGEIVSRYRVTAAGSAVLETHFPDTEREMLTVYCHDGDDLVLTHYCMLGNQPKMIARGDSTRNRLVFECAGVGNATSENEKHMHHATIEILDDDHLRIRWLMFENGEDIYRAAFNLVRRTPEI